MSNNDVWKKQLKTRVPEYNQDRESLDIYLEVCGQIYDELTDAIKLHDVYHDYKNTPESRLYLIGKKFGFSPETYFSEDVMRGIIRDLGSILRTKGITSSIIWAFSLIGWEVKIRQAWLPDPQRYDPNIIAQFPDVFPYEGVDENKLHSIGNKVVYLPVGGGYRVGYRGQTYYPQPDFYMPNKLQVGANFAIEKGSNQNFNIGVSPYTKKNISTFTNDMFKVDAGNFLYGGTETNSSGTYFTGGGLLVDQKAYNDVLIVGETYDNHTATKKPMSVMSTPYIAVEILNYSAVQFVGSQRAYLNGILENVLYDFLRPANVKIITLIDISYFTENINIGETLVQNMFGLDSNITEKTIQVSSNFVQVNLGAEPLIRTGSVTINDVLNNTTTYIGGSPSDAILIGESFAETATSTPEQHTSIITINDVLNNTTTYIGGSPSDAILIGESFAETATSTPEQHTSIITIGTSLSNVTTNNEPVVAFGDIITTSEEENEYGDIPPYNIGDDGFFLGMPTQMFNSSLVGLDTNDGIPISPTPTRAPLILGKPPYTYYADLAFVAQNGQYETNVLVLRTPSTIEFQSIWTTGTAAVYVKSDFGDVWEDSGKVVTPTTQHINTMDVVAIKLVSSTYISFSEVSVVWHNQSTAHPTNKYFYNISIV